MLVLLRWAIPGPQGVGRATDTDSHAFFVSINANEVGPEATLITMTTDLRKVTFTLGVRQFRPNATPDERKEMEERTREREGYFHKWIEESAIHPQTGKPYNQNLALVEDIETGKLHAIDYNLLTFKNDKK